MDLPKIHANLDSLILKAQSDLEEALVTYLDICNFYAEDTMKYRKKRSAVIKKLKKEGMPATLIPDVSRGKTAESKKIMMQSESQKKYFEKLIMAIEHRINNYKFIGRKTDNLAR